MSGIFGIIRFDGAPVEHESLLMMRNAMAYYGPDSGGEWRDGPVGLGQLQLCTTPEDSFEAQPLTMDDVTILAAARLYNRDELLREFGIPVSEHPSTPDSRLVLEAYLKWGEDCLNRLSGDWQFAAWDSRAGKLFIARDHGGVTALFYHSNTDFLAFASSLKAINALPHAPHRPDVTFIAHLLIDVEGENFRTAYDGIFRLLPAHALRVTCKRMEKFRYWFPENLPQIQYADDDEYVEHFLDIYGHAVRSRLRSVRPAGITLSGGRDSGSVAALAAPMLAEDGRLLTAFTAVPRFDLPEDSPDHTCNEWPLAAATARYVSNIRHHPVRSETMSVIAGLSRQLRIDDEPSHNVGNYYWINSLMEQAASRGIGALLIGQGGNGTVSFAGCCELLPHLLRGEYRQAVHALRYSEPNPWLGLKRQLAKPILLPLIRRLQHFIRSEDNSLINGSAINPEFARVILNTGPMKKARRDIRSIMWPLDRRVQLIILEPVWESEESWAHIGARYGMEIRDPTVDRRVVEFCLAIPDRQYRRNGQGNWLFRRAMAGRLPDQVIESRKRGAQSADLGQRLLAERSEIRLSLDRLERNALVRQYLNLPLMRQALIALEQEANQLHVDRCEEITLRGIAVGLFLSSF